MKKIIMVLLAGIFITACNNSGDSGNNKDTINYKDNADENNRNTTVYDSAAGKQNGDTSSY